MEEQKLVLQDGTYKYDDCTRQVSVSEDELRKAGYVKLADDEQVVKKVELSKEEAQFMEKNKTLMFSRYALDDFNSEAEKYSSYQTYESSSSIYGRLIQAYFNGYTVKKEPKYYIKFPKWLLPYSQRINQCFLNVDENGRWDLSTKTHLDTKRTQFTQEEIDVMQRDEQAEGLDLDMLTVKVPPEELKD